MDQIKYLAFSGGGVRGAAYAGIPGYLEEVGILKNIRGIAGTSAGSIIAGLLAMRCEPNYIKNIISSMDFSLFQDDSYGVLLDLYRLGTRYGWNKGDYFINWYDNLLYTVTGCHNLTLQQGFEISGINLIVVSTCCNTRCAEYISHLTHPDLPIAHAVRMSMSYPFFFVPYNYNGKLYVDGGMSNNFAINLFPPDEVLGFKLISSGQAVQDGELVSCENISGLVSYTTNLISIMLSSIENAHVNTEHWNRTVLIKTGNISSMDFSIKGEQVQTLIAEGVSATQELISKLFL